MLTSTAAQEMAGLDDAAVAHVAVEALRKLEPSLYDALPQELGGVRVVRHTQAMPTCPRGHAAAVAAYRAGRAGDPVLLAGDFLGFPWTDSAAATGEWAAGVAVRAAV